MKYVKLVFLFCTIIGFHSVKSQDLTDSSLTKNDATLSEIDTTKKPFLYNLGFGLFNYRGDVGYIDSIGTTENLQPAFNAGFEYKISSTLGLGVNLGYGSLVKNESKGIPNRNFKTTLISGGLSVNIHFANGFILAEDYDIDPFISIGFDFINFNPKTDLKDAKGNTYYYWGDGTIRDIEYYKEYDRDLRAGDTTANKLERDYNYETDLISGDESNIAFSIPVSLGFNFNINNYLQAQLKQTISLTNTDLLDGFAGGSPYDVYMYSSLSFIFNPSKVGSKKENSKEFDDIDFVALLKIDSDSDGIFDIDDKCNDTEPDIKVDRHGCPKDNDEDGIPDHLDYEDNTNDTVAQIDSNGVAIPDSIFAIRVLDSIVTLRQELCLFYPSMCQGDETDIKFSILNNGYADRSLISARAERSKKPIEDIIKICDNNKDGKITSKEIYESIDNYFDGKIDIELGDIHKLIDYYFEQ
ncbi:MAG: hypothetical protein CMD18_07670 [Flavobacteriales bacterium]|nr:hypothetical protein [Flavobacteriales bacterium]